MAQLTVRKLDEGLVLRLKIRAAHHNRSAEAEHRAILEGVLGVGRYEFWQRATELRAATRGRPQSDSTDLIRGDRDREPAILRP